MVICGQEFDFSALNANDIDRVETAQRHMEAASDREKQRQHTGIADVLRGQCRLLMNFLDEALGEGASERLGLDGNDFGACKHVMDEFTKAISAEQASMNLAAAVPMNREQRRAQKNGKHKNKPPMSYPAQSASRSEVFCSAAHACRSDGGACRQGRPPQAAAGRTVGSGKWLTC